MTCQGNDVAFLLHVAVLIGGFGLQLQLENVRDQLLSTNEAGREVNKFLLTWMGRVANRCYPFSASNS